MTTRQKPAGMHPNAAAGTPAAQPEQPQAAAPSADAHVLTPGGYRIQSLVHHIDPEHVLDLASGNIRQMHIAGHEVRDFGPLLLRPAGVPLMPGNVQRNPDRLPALGSGWITYASWTNNSGHPVARFATPGSSRQPPRPIMARPSSCSMASRTRP